MHIHFPMLLVMFILFLLLVILAIDLIKTIINICKAEKEIQKLLDKYKENL